METSKPKFGNSKPKVAGDSIRGLGRVKSGLSRVKSGLSRVKVEATFFAFLAALFGLALVGRDDSYRGQQAGALATPNRFS